MSGKGADIYFSPYGELDFENLGEKGALADLYEFIDADSDISRDDFVQSILKAMEYKGKLYAVSPDFSLNTIVGKNHFWGSMISGITMLCMSLQRATRMQYFLRTVIRRKILTNLWRIH